MDTQYLVYAIAENRFEVLEIPRSYKDKQIRGLIAQYENNPEKSNRRYKTKIQVGSHNYKLISKSVGDKTDAEIKARAEGLKFELRSEVLKKYKAGLRKAAAQFTKLGYGDTTKVTPVEELILGLGHRKPKGPWSKFGIDS